MCEVQGSLCGGPPIRLIGSYTLLCRRNDILLLADALLRKSSQVWDGEPCTATLLPGLSGLTAAACWVWS